MNAMILRYIDTMADATPLEELAALPESERVLIRCTAEIVRLIPSLASDPQLAEEIAGTVDWHDLERLIKAGCDPRVALRILV